MSVASSSRFSGIGADFVRSVVAPHLFAIVATWLVLELRLSLGGVLGGNPTLVLFTIPIILSAYWGGLSSGLLATFLTWAGSAYYLFPPIRSFAISDPVASWHLSILLTAGVLISVICERLRRSRRQAEAVIAELRHKKEEVKDALKVAGELRTALDDHAIVAITDARGKITFVNDKFCAISRYSREELVGRDHRLINSGHHPKEFIRDLWDTISSGRTWTGEIKNRAKDGTFYWVATTIVPFLDEAGKPRQYIAIRADITERMRMEEEVKTALKAAEELRMALDDHAIVAITDARGKITFVNDKFCAISRYSREELVGRDHRLINSGHHPKEFIRDLWDTISSGRTWHGEIKNRAKDGTYYWVATTIVPFLDEAGKPRQYIAIRADITERMRMEEEVKTALKAAEELRMALDDHAIVAITDARGKITFVNDKFCAISRYSREELVGRDHRLINSGHHPKEFIRDLWGTISSGRTWHGEIKNRAKDGTYYWVATTIVPFLDETGTPRQYIAIRADITERKRMEEALREGEARYRALFDYAPDGILICDPRGTYLDGNTSVCRMLGYAHDELVGMHANQIVADNEIANVDPALTAITAGAQYHREWYFRRKDDSVFAADVIATSMPDGSVMGMIRDITERRRADEALREKDRQLHRADRRLAEIVNGMTEACFALDPEWRFTFVNDRGEQLLRHRSEQMLGHSIWEVFHQLKGTPMEARYRHAMATRQPAAFVAFSPIAERWLDIRLFPTAEGIAAFLLDIHERKLAEEKIHQLNDQLERRVSERTAELEVANRELEAFSYSVSHDLRAPLRSVDGFAQAVAEDYGSLLPEEGRQYLATIRDGAQQMGRLIDDLLTFSRLSRAPLARLTVDANRLVRDAAHVLDFMLVGREVELRIAELPPCSADPALLRQVWLNLLSNAFKYTGRRERAVVEVGCSRDADGDVVYFVRDNGTGFDMRYADKLFGVFQRLHRMEDYEGTGVGLAIVQRVLHRHGGRIWAEAEVDLGATFFFTLHEPSQKLP